MIFTFINLNIFVYILDSFDYFKFFIHGFLKPVNKNLNIP